MATKICTANGSAQISTAQSKFGGSSLRLATALSDYVSIPDDADFAFGSGDFTVDFWVRKDNNSGNNYFCGQVQDSANFNGFLVGTMGSVQTSGWDFNGSYSLGTTTGQWYHLEFARSGTTYYAFVDGVSKTVTTVLGNTSNAWKDQAGSFYVGNNPQGYFGNDFAGYIDEFRISKGIARHTSGFTPPSSAYTTDAYTVLLLHFDGTNGSTTITDSSVSSTDYPLTAAQGSYTLTGQTTLLKLGRKMTSALGTYVLTGFSAALSRGKILVAAYGTYALTGFSTAITSTRKLIAAQGSYALTGYAIASKIKTLMGQISYSLTGFAASVTGQRKITGAQGSYTLTGYTLAFQRTAIMRMVTGTYTLTGQIARLLYNGISTVWHGLTKTSEGSKTNQSKTAAPTWVDGTKT